MYQLLLSSSNSFSSTDLLATSIMAIPALFASLIALVGFGIALIIAIIFVLLETVLVVLAVICNWKIMEKAGEPGWKALIPFYNMYVLYSISTNKVTKNVCFFTIIGASAVSMIANFIAMIFVFIPYIGPIIVVFIRIITTVLFIAPIVFIAFLNVGLPKSFGMESGLRVLSIFIPIVPRIMMAFGKWQYTGDKLTIFGKPDDDIPTV